MDFNESSVPSYPQQGNDSDSQPQSAHDLRIIVTGSKSFEDYDFFRQKMIRLIEGFDIVQKKGHGCVELLTGRAATGPEDMVYHFARWDYSFDYEQFIADWDKHGKQAGQYRNDEMGEYASKASSLGVIIVFWDGEAKGAKGMLEIGYRYKLQTHMFVTEGFDVRDRVELVDFNPQLSPHNTRES